MKELNIMRRIKSTSNPSAVLKNVGAGISRKGITRRQFLNRAAATWATVSIVPSHVIGAAGQTPPSDKLGIGIIGLGIRGGHDDEAGLTLGFTANSKCRVRAVCDVNRQHLDSDKAYVDQQYNSKDCTAYRDFREMLQRDDIDGVVVATPEHWHAAMTIMACEHGKDVYCEKPLSFNIRQGREMVDAARRYNRVVQTGSHARSSKKFASVIRLIQEGKLGKLNYVLVTCDGPSDISNAPADPVPDFLDYDLWVGPAQWRPFSKSLVLDHGWNSCINFGGGNLTDWGAHFFDMAQWALGMSYSGPVEVHPADGKQYKFTTLRYADGMEVRRSPRPPDGKGGTTFFGTEGTIDTLPWSDYCTMDPPSLGAQYQVEASMGRGQSLGACAAHIDNFLDCMRTRQKPHADVEIGHRSVTCAHINAICERLGRSLRWDPVKEQFENDDEANRHLDSALRAPWHL
jgi:predicted dehydrogenase